MNPFLLAIFLSQMHFLLTAPIPNVPNHLQLFANEVTKTGNKILAELKKPESTMNLHTECSNLEFDAKQIISQCKEEQYAEGCREWWLSFRNSVGSYKGMMLMPNYVQYYRELIELAEECQGKNAKKGHGNIYDNLYGGTMPCYKPLHKGGKEITSNNCQQTEEWKKRFQKYFEGAEIEDKGNDMIDEGNNFVTVYYNEIFKHNGEILYHPAIFVYNTIIHFEGQTGVFIHTLDEYIPDKDKATVGLSSPRGVEWYKGVEPISDSHNRQCLFSRPPSPPPPPAQFAPFHPQMMPSDRLQMLTLAECPAHLIGGLPNVGHPTNFVVELPAFLVAPSDCSSSASSSFSSSASASSSSISPGGIVANHCCSFASSAESGIIADLVDQQQQHFKRQQMKQSATLPTISAFTVSNEEGTKPLPPPPAAMRMRSLPAQIRAKSAKSLSMLFASRVEVVIKVKSVNPLELLRRSLLNYNL